MWINTNNGKIYKSAQQLTIGEITYPPQIFKDKQFLLDNGIKPYREVGVDSRYYWQGQKTLSETDTEVVATYEAIPRDVEQLKAGMLAKVSTTFKALAVRPVVDTGLGFYVDGGKDDVKNFEIGKKYSLPQVKDIDGVMHDVTVEDYDIIISAIETNGIALYQEKWNKEVEISNLVDIDSVKAYENKVFIETRLVETKDEDGNVISTSEETSEVTKDTCTYFVGVIVKDSTLINIVEK